MSSLLEDLAEQVINQACGAGPKRAVLRTLVIKASDMLAEMEGHGEAAALHARQVRRHEEKRCGLGVDRRARR